MGVKEERGLWSEQLFAPHAIRLVWNVLGQVWWPLIYGMVSMFGIPGLMCWLFSLGLMVCSFELGEAMYACWPRLGICISIVCLMLWFVHALESPNIRVCVDFVIEISEVIWHIITDHSKTTQSHIHRHTSPCAHWTQWNTHKTHSLNTPQLEQMTQLMIKTHISSSGMHTSTLFDWTDTTLSYHWIPNGITPCTYLFPFQQWHVYSSIRTHTHISCECYSYQ